MSLVEVVRVDALKRIVHDLLMLPHLPNQTRSDTSPSLQMEARKLSIDQFGPARPKRDELFQRVLTATLVAHQVLVDLPSEPLCLTLETMEWHGDLGPASSSACRVCEQDNKGPIGKSSDDGGAYSSCSDSDAEDDIEPRDHIKRGDDLTLPS